MYVIYDSEETWERMTITVGHLIKIIDMKKWIPQIFDKVKRRDRAHSTTIRSRNYQKDQ
jgi:hypothetical protein